MRSDGITLIQRLLFLSGGQNCNLELAVEVWRTKEEGGRQADIKSNNPRLTGGE